MTDRVTVTLAAAELMRRLKAIHGDLMFHQSDGCCDGSAPLWYPNGEFRVGRQDVLLNHIQSCPFYISAP